MKIGILTFWRSEDNYGQLLQCYATQTFLRSLGHETFLVKTSNGYEHEPSIKKQLMDKVRTAYRLKSYPLYFIKRAIGSALFTLTHGKLRAHYTQRGFEEFRREYLNCTKEYSLEMLRNNPPKADAFVAGSDQIWNTTDGIYFLSWVPDDIMKVSMAASFGYRQLSMDFCDLIRPWLKRFDLITVREKSGLSICVEAGRKDAYLVPDPTLLLRSEDYMKIVSNNYPQEPYLFIYFLGTQTKVNWKEIHKFAKDKGLRIVYVGSQGVEDKFKKEEPTIHEWLALMANAEYVITNSFHGTIFAIQFNKRFIVYPVTGVAAKMNDRLHTLLYPLNLENHIYLDTIEPLDSSIDYSRVFSLLAIQTAEAKSKFSAFFSNKQ